MIYSSWDIKCERLKLVIMDHFCPFTLPKNPKNQNFENMKKMLEISSFYKSVPETTIMRYSSWDMELHRQDSFLSLRAIFCRFTPVTTWKIKTLRKWKKHLDMSSFYTYVPKITIIWCMLPEIWSTRDKFFHFGSFFTLYWPQKSKFGKNEENAQIHYYHLTHLYHKWKSYDVCSFRYGMQQMQFLSFWAIFCLFTPLTIQKIKIFQIQTSTWRFHDFTQVYQKPWLFALLFLTCGMWGMWLLFFILGYFLPFYMLYSSKN